MALFRSTKTKSVQRPTHLVKLRVTSRNGEVLDEQEIWNALVDCFRKHPTLDVHQAETIPDYDH